MSNGEAPERGVEKPVKENVASWVAREQPNNMIVVEAEGPTAESGDRGTGFGN